LSIATETKETPTKGRGLDNRVTFTAGIRKGDNTMEEAHRFRVVAWWASGRTGIAKSGSAPNAIHFTSPPAFGGLEGRWTPEDLLLCALAGCYTTTFQAVAESSKLEYTDLQVEVEAMIRRAETGYAFSEVLVRANLMLPQPEEEARAVRLLQKAEGLCLVSRALAVKPTFELHVQQGAAPVESGHTSSIDSEGGSR